MEYDEAYSYFMSNLMILQKSIIPVFGPPKGKNGPEFIGTSVYCKEHDAHFLLSAGHVFKQANSYKLWYPFSNVLSLEIPSSVYAYPNKEERDFCVIPLDKPLENWNPIDTSVFGDFHDQEEYQHILIGYPGSKVIERNQNNENSTKLTIMGYLTSAGNQDAITRAKLDEDFQFGVVFHKKNVFGESRKAMTFPDPNGMSGGPIFEFHEKRPLEQKLVGIMTEWRSTSYKLIVGTKVKTIMKGFSIVKRKT